MSEKGWIKLDRSIQNHWIWEKPLYAYYWIDLLLLANHAENKRLVNDQLQTFQRGTVNRSIRSLAARWRCDHRTATKFLKLLESEKMITLSCTTQGTTITLINYEKYQGSSDNDVPRNEPDHDPRCPHGMPTNKNVKNDKNERSNNIYSDSDTEKPKNQRHKYGTYNNVLLSDQELEKLKERFPDNFQYWINCLSEGLEVHGYKYKSHYAAILNWAKRDTQKPAPAGGRNTAGKEINVEHRKKYETFT